MAGRVRWVPRRHVCPRCSGPKHPEDAVQDVARVAPRPTALPRRSLQLGAGYEVANRLPLLVGQVHPPLQNRSQAGLTVPPRKQSDSDRLRISRGSEMRSRGRAWSAFHVIAAVAELEPELNRERTIAGVAAAKLPWCSSRSSRLLDRCRSGASAPRLRQVVPHHRERDGRLGRQGPRDARRSEERSQIPIER